MRHGTSSGGAYRHEEYGGGSAAASFDRSDATVHYGGLFANHRAASYVYGGAVNDAPTSASENRRKRREERRREKVGGRRGEQRRETHREQSRENRGEQRRETHREQRREYRGIQRENRRDLRPAESDASAAVYSKPAFIQISGKEKAILIFAIVLVICTIGAKVLIEAKGASIQHDVNKTRSEIADIQKEIDELYVAIEQGKNIETVEKIAKDSLNMVYPSSEQIKYEADIKAKDEDVAVAGEIGSEDHGA